MRLYKCILMFFALVLFFCLNANTYAQSDFCDTWEAYKQSQMDKNGMVYHDCDNGPCDDPSNRDSAIPGPTDPIKTYQLYFNIFCEDDGSNCATTEAMLSQQVVELNADYLPMRIQFVYDYRFVNSSLYRHNPNLYNMKNAHAVSPGTQMNIYIVERSGSRGTFPWDDVNLPLSNQGGVALSDGHVYPSPYHDNVLSHEIGHTLGLWHTHHGVSEVTSCGECYERADGVNANTTGDLCAETPPTPLNRYCSDPGGTDGCSSTPWGQTSPQNFMSYAPIYGGNCWNEFTPQQWGRINCWTDQVLSAWSADPPPVAAFGSSTTSGAVPWSVIFIDSSTNNPTSWDWDFGDGGTSVNPIVFYTYNDPGTYTVSLTATNAGGSDTETKTDYIHVYGPPVADFTASPTSGNGPLMVSFTDLSTEAVAWIWDFGDGGTSQLQNPYHLYTSFGDFDVSLQVANTAGTDTETKLSYISIDMTEASLFGDVDNYSASGYSRGVAANDFNGDNDIDLAVMTYSIDYAEHIVYYENNGDGSFTSAGTYSCSEVPYDIVSADFDGNGYPDLVIANPIKWDGGYISIIYNGGGYFTSPENHYTGTWYPYGLATGDIDNDNDTDIVVVQEDGNNIVIFKNTVGYFFGDTSQYYISGYSPKAVVTADFNNDTWLDIATADWANMSVLMNNGDGTYPASVEYPTNASEGRTICAADFDGDGDCDVAVGNTVSDDVSVFLNNGDGTFAVAVLYAICNEPYSIKAGDFNGDNLPDIVVANKSCVSSSILLNNGDGTFGTATEIALGTGAKCVVTGDFDNDNDIDLAFTNGYENSNNLKVLLNLTSDLPAAPVLSYPTEGSSTTDHSPTMNWEDVAGASSYDVVLDNDSDFTSLTRSRVGLITSQWDVSPNLADDYYYWRARAVNSFGPGPWSESNRFRVWTSGGGTPSCPVLYAFDGNDFIQENPLLTACEQTNYTETVTDYYHVTKDVLSENGVVTFQLREMEDEITYLQNIELITVDHSSGTKVSVSVDGDIGLARDLVPPLSAFDQLGEDRLAEILAEDGEFFVCDGPGHLIVTFPNTGDGSATFAFSAKDKEFCRREYKESGEDGQEPLAGFKVEFLDANGTWIEGPWMPSRTNHTQEMVTSNLPIGDDQAEITIRISWVSGYFTDVIQQYIPTDETPQIVRLNVAGHTMVSSVDAAKTSSGFDAPEPMIMVNGDVFQFTFNTGEIVGDGLVRDYVIRAVGRYIPDYSVFTNLLPTQVQLYSNYPNPFNPTTKIDFYLPQTSDVSLDIFNILGRRVTTLIDGRTDAGMNSVTWHGTDLGGHQVASGVYFYKLTVGEETKTKRMVLVK